MLTLLALLVAFILGGIYAGRLVVLLHQWYAAALAKVRGWLHLAPVLLLACATPFAPQRMDAQTAHPHEPAGFLPLASHNANTVPAPGGSPWWFAAGRLSVVRDSVRGPVWQTVFPAGLKGGLATVNVGVRRFPEQRSLYFSAWVRFPGRDFEDQATGCKCLGFFGNADKTQGDAQTYLMIPSYGAPQPGTAFRWELRQQVPVVRNMPANVDRRNLVTVGSWHLIEAMFTLNTLGQANGTAQLWTDGVLTLDYRNIVWRTPAQPHGFFTWKWNDTWGGGNWVNPATGKSELQIKSRPDAMQLDDIYLSGVP